jgi:hypothetical protein
MFKMKKVIVFLLCTLFVAFSLFAQDIETLTYYDPAQDSNVTVKAMHIGWERNYTTISNTGTKSAKLLTYASVVFTTAFVDAFKASSKLLEPV